MPLFRWETLPKQRKSVSCMLGVVVWQVQEVIVAAAEWGLMS